MHGHISSQHAGEGVLGHKAEIKSACTVFSQIKWKNPYSYPAYVHSSSINNDSKREVMLMLQMLNG